MVLPPRRTHPTPGRRRVAPERLRARRGGGDGDVRDVRAFASRARDGLWRPGVAESPAPPRGARGIHTGVTGFSVAGADPPGGRGFGGMGRNFGSGDSTVTPTRCLREG